MVSQNPKHRTTLRGKDKLQFFRLSLVLKDSYLTTDNRKVNVAMVQIFVRWRVNKCYELISNFESVY